MSVEKISDYPCPIYRVKTFFGYELWGGRNAGEEPFSNHDNLINITVPTEEQNKGV